MKKYSLERRKKLNHNTSTAQKNWMHINPPLNKTQPNPNKKWVEPNTQPQSGQLIIQKLNFFISKINFLNYWVNNQKIKNLLIESTKKYVFLQDCRCYHLKGQTATDRYRSEFHPIKRPTIWKFNNSIIDFSKYKHTKMYFLTYWVNQKIKKITHFIIECKLFNNSKLLTMNYCIIESAAQRNVKKRPEVYSCNKL